MRLHFLLGCLCFFILCQMIGSQSIEDQSGENHATETESVSSTPVATHHPKNNRKQQRVKIGKKHKIIHRKIQNTRPLTTKQVESTEFIFTKNNVNNNNNNNLMNYNPYSYQDTVESGNDQDTNSDLDSAVKVTDLTVKVGDTAILKCAINSTYGSNPGVIWMQGKLGSVLTLNTNRITVDTRFEIVQLPLDTQPDTRLADIEHNLIISSNNNNKRDGQMPLLLVQPQLPELSYYHLKIVNVQIFDENEYACETSITKNNDDQPSLHSLIRLHVTRTF